MNDDGPYTYRVRCALYAAAVAVGIIGSVVIAYFSWPR